MSELSDDFIANRPIVITDLDGTVADCRHREHLAQNKEWDAFHSLIPDDKPHIDVCTMLQALKTEEFLLIGVTGRPYRNYQATTEWLMQHSVPLDILLMRSDTDFRSDTVVKEELLFSLFEGDRERALKRVLFILEDRDKMVEHWRNLGFKCWQVRHGGY